MPPPDRNDAASSHRPEPALPDDHLISALESALAAERETVGTQLGPYHLRQKIGEGGFGVVWMAEQLAPLQRRVALKILKAGMDSEEVIARFEAERQALALLDHPNIARVFDAGTTASGRPFFVMELVRGVPVTQYCDQNRLSAEARLRLFLPICQAVQHAHHKGIIHRDLKPSNILVTLHDGVPVPKIIDFGIAKALDQRLTERTLITRFHAFVGTPVYTSPEQMEMSGLDVDTRSDIYSLGVLLYELLAGRPPFDPAALLQSGFEAMRRTLRESDPPRPSHRLGTLDAADRSTVAQQRGTDPARLQVFLRGDVDWIVMRCLEKDRTRRYDTAAALAEDIRRHLENEPIAARPPRPLYRIGKYIRRHRLGAAAIGAVTLSVLGGLIASSWALVLERAARARAVAAERAEAGLRQQAEAHRRTEAQRASRTSQALAEQLLAEGRTAEGLAHLVRAARSDPDNPVVGPRLLAAIATRNFALPVGEDLVGLAQAGYADGGRVLWTISTDGVVQQRELTAGAGSVSLRLPPEVFAGGGQGRFAMSDSGRWLAVADRAGLVTQYRWPDSRRAGVCAHGRELAAMAYSPDDRWLLTAGFDGLVQVWETATSRLCGTLPHARPVGTLNFSADGARVVTSTGSRGHWQVWRLPEGAALTPPLPALTTANQGAFNAAGTLLALADNYGVNVCDARAGYRRLHRFEHDGPCYSLEFSPDGRRLVTTSDDATARLWEMPTGKPWGGPLRHGARLVAARFSRDGRKLFTHSGDGAVHVWEVSTGRRLLEPIGLGSAQSFALSGRDDEFLTLSQEGVARRWRPTPSALQPLRLPDEAERVSVTPDARRPDVVWVLTRQALQTIDLLSGRALGAPRPLPVPVRFGVLAPGAAGAAVSLAAGGYEIWDLRPPTLVRRPIQPVVQADSLHFSPDGRHLAALDARFNLRVWEASTGTLVLGPLPEVSRASAYAFSPDGRRVAVGTREAIILYDLERRQPVGEPLRFDGGNRIRFSADGAFLAAGALNQVALWALREQPVRRHTLPHRGPVRGLVFSRDDRLLLTYTSMETLLWQVDSGQLARPPLVGGNDIAGAYFLAGETVIATWARTQSEMRLWSRAEGRLLADPLRLGDRLAENRYLVTDQAVLTNTGPGLALVWPQTPLQQSGPAPDWLLRLATVLAGGEIDADAMFRPAPIERKIFFALQQEVAALPATAPWAAWGQWLLADRATRPLAPGFRLTAREAARARADEAATEERK